MAHQMASPSPAMAQRPPRILLVEEDAGMGTRIRDDLAVRQYDVNWLMDGEAALDEVRAAPDAYALMILEGMLPGLDGLDLVERLRSAEISLPVLLLSAVPAVNDRVRGLKAGGDDYLTKPFACAELAARIDALLCRRAAAAETLLRAGDLELDLVGRVVRRRGAQIRLLPREFRLLEYFVRRPGQIVTRAMLLEDLWNYRFIPQTNLIDVHLGRLRRKIDESGAPSMIASIRGVGFQFRTPA